MRELKFRIWDGEKFLHTQMSQRLLNDEGGHPYLPLYLDAYFKQPGFDFVIQQSTGFKAENGKDIYEGDFVKIKTWGKEYTIKVYWNDLRLSVDGQREIIGNIFETPELLDENEKE